MRTIAASAFAMLTAFVVVHPASAQLKMGDSNQITQTGTITGAQITTATGPDATAMSGNASIMAAGGITLGNSNRVTQTGTITGAQITTATGPDATAMSGNASIMAGR